MEVSQQPASSLQQINYGDVFNNIFLITICVIQILFIGLFALTKYPDNPYGLPDLFQNNLFSNDLALHHQVFIDINVFLLIGFGFILSYIRFHRWMSLSLTLFIAAISVQIYLLFSAFWNKSFNGGWADHETITMLTMIACEKGAVAVLISLGAVIGKVDTFQILIMCIFELFFYTLNEAILFYSLLYRDMGGAIYIHMFAGLFGVFVSWVYTNKSNCEGNPNKNGNYNTITLSFVGTFLLWSLFPTFNSVNPLHKTQYSNTRFLSILNTFWSLSASTISTFLLTTIIKNGMLLIDNITYATLSGGVIIAASSDMFSMPFGPLIIGAIGGLASSSCNILLTPLMEKILIFDTRGILFLHALPGLLGGIISAISCAFLESAAYGSGSNVRQGLLFDRSAPSQGGFQILALLITLGLSSISGIACGFILRLWRFFSLPIDTFGDHIYFKMNIPDPAIPYANQIPQRIISNNNITANILNIAQPSFQIS